MATTRLAVIGGDGIGPEVVAEGLKVLDAVLPGVETEHYDLGANQAAEYPRAADHPSHVLLKVVAGSDSDDGMCVVEPRVRCNHCGFCQSFGH